MTKISKQHPSLDALLPHQMAHRAESAGEAKVKLDFTSTFVLAVLAGAFIAWGGAFFAVVVTGNDLVPYGISKMLGGLAFSLGLILVIVAGAELFTGNNLIVMAWASRRITTAQVLQNWIIVYVGNFVGAFGMAVLLFTAGIAEQHSGSVGETVVQIGYQKCSIKWINALAAGIGCNVLVCLAVWLCMSARSVADKILAIIFPISAFVATGMEHCVANMFFVPLAMLIQSRQDYVDGGDEIQLIDFLANNLFPVTIGNIIGGAVFVGMVYWFVYLRTDAEME